MSEQTLEVATEAQEPSQPTEEVKQDVEQGSDAAPVEQANEAKPAEKPLTELEKTKHAMQKRIDQKTATTKALEDRLNKVTQELETFKTAQPKHDDAPKADDFEDYEQYEQAKIQHEANKIVETRLHEAKQAEHQRLQQQQAAEKAKAFKAAENAFIAENADYKAVATEVNEVVGDLHRRGVDVKGFGRDILAFDIAPQLIYEIGKDTGLIEELVQMEQPARMRELVKLEMGLRPPKETENAPAPIKPVNPKGKRVTSIAKMASKDFKDWLNE